MPVYRNSQVKGIVISTKDLYFLAMRCLFIISVMFLSACASGLAERDSKAIERRVVPMLVPTVSYEPACLNLVGVGDIMLGGTANPTLQEKGYDYPFDGTRSWLQNADIAVANLETALSHGGQAFDKKYTFRNPPEKVAPALKAAGFDLVGLANNHTLDYGLEGLKDTLHALDEVGLPAVGAGLNQMQAREPKIIIAQGQKIGFLAYSMTFPEEFWATKTRAGTAFGHAAHVKADVAKLKEQVDHVVVQFHWGREGKTELRDYQVALGRASIDAGATVVLGHHPHILQAIEQYKNGVIYYSLGNFAFGSFSNRVQTGGVADIELCRHGLGGFALKVVDVNNYRVRFQPVPVTGERLKAEYEHLLELSSQRNTQLELKGEEIVGR